MHRILHPSINGLLLAFGQEPIDDAHERGKQLQEQIGRHRSERHRSDHATYDKDRDDAKGYPSCIQSARNTQDRKADDHDHQEASIDRYLTEQRGSCGFAS